MIYSLTINQKLLHQLEVRFGRCFDYRHSVLMAFFQAFFSSTHSAVLRHSIVDKYGTRWWFLSYSLIHRSLPYFRIRHHATLGKLIDPLITHGFLNRKKIWQIEQPPPDNALPPTPTLQGEKKPPGRVKLYFAPGKHFTDFFYRATPSPSSHAKPTNDLGWLEEMFGDDPTRAVSNDLTSEDFSSNNQTNRDEGMVGLPSST